MTFLSLSTLLAGAAVAVPLLLLLYFLKLRRRPLVISSTLLWRRAVHDLQVNAPFQRLRRNLLLILQLLVLGALLFSVGNPVGRFLERQERTVVILMDRSASMQSGDSAGPRLDLAKRAAAALVSELGPRDRAMLIAFADRAAVLCPFTADRRQLLRQIDAVEPVEARTSLAEALQLAVAYSSHLVDSPRSTTPLPSAPPADIELFSDGRIPDAADQAVQRGQMRFHRVGDARDNVGIVALDVRRAFERPEQVSVFARIENLGPAPIRADLTLLLDGRVMTVRELSLGAAEGDPTTRAAAAAPGPPAAQLLAFDFDHPAAGELTLRLERPDGLAVDNAAFAVVPAPRPLAILGVGDRPVIRNFIIRAVAGVAGASIEWMSAGEYERAGEARLAEAGRSRFDLVIFDRHDPARSLPPGSYLLFGGVPRMEGVRAVGDVEDEHVADVDETHALMRYVIMDQVHVLKWRRLELPAAAIPLVEGPRSHIISFFTDAGRQCVLVAFDLLDSDFPLKLPFVIFMQNVVRTLAGGGGDVPRPLRPGETMAAPIPRGARNASVLRPDGSSDSINLPEEGTQLTYARTDRVGLYRVRFDDPDRTSAAFAVSLLDREESAIGPADGLRVGGDILAASSDIRSVNRPLWPYAAGAALILLMIEWWVYNRRVMI